LFVVTSPIEPLTVWLHEAELRNPTLALIKSKGQAADQGIVVAKADFLPQVSVPEVISPEVSLEFSPV
jgi:outer membrane protein TolC